MLHGLMGSSLYLTYENSARYWYCPRSMNNQLVWIQKVLFLYPQSNCMMDLLRVHYDNVTKTVSTQPSIQIINNDSSLSAMKDEMVKRGYTYGDNLFIPSYDWRMAPFGLEKFYSNLKNQIEATFTKHGQKVTLLGYSLGSHVIHFFLVRYCGEEWVSKYIHNVVLMAPAIAGASQAMVSLWKGEFGAPISMTDIVHEAVWSFPSAHVLSPNHFYYENDTMIIGPDNTHFNASSLPELYKRYSAMGTQDNGLHDLTTMVNSKPLKHFGVPTYIYFNSGINTVYSADMSKGWNNVKVKYSKGDGTVPSEPLKRLCKDWESKGQTICKDFATSSTSFNHGGFGNNPVIEDLVFNVTNDVKTNQFF